MPSVDSAEQLTTTTCFGSRFLVPLDVSATSERVAEMACWFAKKTGGEPLLASVVSVDEESPIRKLYVRSVAQTLQSRFDMPIGTSVAVAPSVARGLSESLTDDTSVFMATAARLGPHDGHIGSIAENLVRHASRPCMLVGPRATASFEDGPNRIIVPVDGSELSELALAPAAELARMMGVPMWIVTVVTRRMQDAASLAGVDPTTESSYVRNLAVDLAEDSLDVEFEVLHGDTAADSILDFAGRDSAIVMSTHGRSGVMRIALGSVTSRVVRYSPFPTLVVPPGQR